VEQQVEMGVVLAWEQEVDWVEEVEKVELDAGEVQEVLQGVAFFLLVVGREGLI